MSYQINAYLDRGVPSLQLIDAQSGEERLHWHQPQTTSNAEMRHAWQALFRRLVVLSCADREQSCSQQNAATTSERSQSRVKTNGHYDVPMVNPASKAKQAAPNNVVYLPVRNFGGVR